MIENRNLKAGTKLVARYKGKEHTAEVVKTADGMRYRLEDGQEFKSPSSAGSAVMAGAACNGWRWWSIAGEDKTALKNAPAKKRKIDVAIKPMDDQADVPEGQVRFWCSACMDSFTAPVGVEPLACPKGHANEPVATAAS